ncbi:Collagen alpha-1(XX) chain, partial [Toxocara canis]
GGASAIVVIVIIIIIFIIVLLLLCYAVYRYRKEKPERTQRTDEGILLKHYDRRTGQVVPISWTPTFNGPRLERLSTDVQPKNSFNENVDDHHTTMSSIFTGTTTGSKHTAMTLNTELTKATDSKKNASVENVDEERKGRVHDGHASIDGDSNKSEDPNALHTDEEMEAMGEVNEDGEMSETDSANDFLPINHPAKTLPPIDLLLLIDSSGSIGLTNFEQMKKYINAVLNNVDISPGRSRVATVIFATEPKVSFGFDKYYTQRSVQASVTKLPYLGGPTFLSKALVFAAGILYQEQNMKDGKHRKHKLMPTPKHDRLQVMIVVSDGYSEDNFDNAATILHEKLHVKIAALVGRSYNKERLMPITRFEGAIFVKEHTEALSIWLWRQQRLWNENFGSYVEKEKSLPLDRTTTNSSPRKKK